MMSNSGRMALVVPLCLLLSLAGCSRSPRVSFYVLSPQAKPEAGAPVRFPAAVKVGPVTLPELVDRPQMVTGPEGSQVDILELHRWAEPLKSQIPRIIAADLGLLLGSDAVYHYPQLAGNDAEYRVQLDFQRFESAGDTVSVDAVWVLRKGETVLKSGRSQVRETVAGVGYDALVRAYGRALAAVSRDISQALAGSTPAQAN